LERKKREFLRVFWREKQEYFGEKKERIFESILERKKREFLRVFWREKRENF
jgi:hypothetical protein